MWCFRCWVGIGECDLTPRSPLVTIKPSSLTILQQQPELSPRNWLKVDDNQDTMDKVHHFEQKHLEEFETYKHQFIAERIRKQIYLKCTKFPL